MHPPFDSSGHCDAPLEEQPIGLKPLQERSVPGLFMEINRRFAIKCFYQLKAFGLHPGQVPILALLNEKDGYSQKELAALLKVKPPTVTVSLQRLEKAGFLCRRQDEKDQRVSRIYLTDMGRRAVEKGMEQMGEYEKVFLNNISETEQALLRRILFQILENIDGLPGAIGEEPCDMHIK